MIEHIFQSWPSDIWEGRRKKPYLDRYFSLSVSDLVSQILRSALEMGSCHPSSWWAFQEYYYHEFLHTDLQYIDDFEARSPDELSLQKGERIELIERDDDFGDGWYLGKHITNGKIGLFPEGRFAATNLLHRICDPIEN